MKPPLFDYVVPETLDAAIAALAEDEFARPLAGGQSLIPGLNFRIANPTRLVDLRKLDELRGIQVANGSVRVGAMTRHRELELDDAAHGANPLIREVLGNVAHIAIRNRGTIGGNLANADAASEMPALLLAMDGSVEVKGPNGSRSIAAGDLFEFHMTTALEPDEILTHVVIPNLPAGQGAAFREYTRRRGDYAIVGVAAVIGIDGGGTCTAARLAACGVSSTALRLGEAEQALVGSRLDEAALQAAAEAAAQRVEAPDDLNASNALRRRVARTLVKRTVAAAAERATAGA